LAKQTTFLSELGKWSARSQGEASREQSLPEPPPNVLLTSRWKNFSRPSCRFAEGKWVSVPSAAQEVCIPWGGAQFRGGPVRLRLRGCTSSLSQESLPKGSHQAEEAALCPFRHQSSALPGDLQGRLLQLLLQLQNADKPYLGDVPCIGLPLSDLQPTLLMCSAVLCSAVH